MKHEAANYGIQRDYEAHPAPYPPGGTMSLGEERTWSALAHLSAFLNVFTGFLGPVAALVIWLVHRGRSQAVAAHALRSALHQAIWLSALAVGWAVAGALTVVLIGFLLFPLMGLATLLFFLHATYEAYRAYRQPHSA